MPACLPPGPDVFCCCLPAGYASSCGSLRKCCATICYHWFVKCWFYIPPLGSCTPAAITCLWMVHWLRTTLALFACRRTFSAAAAVPRRAILRFLRVHCRLRVGFEPGSTRTRPPAPATCHHSFRYLPDRIPVRFLRCHCARTFTHALYCAACCTTPARGSACYRSHLRMDTTDLRARARVPHATPCARFSAACHARIPPMRSCCARRLVRSCARTSPLRAGSVATMANNWDNTATHCTAAPPARRVRFPTRYRAWVLRLPLLPFTHCAANCVSTPFLAHALSAHLSFDLGFLLTTACCPLRILLWVPHIPATTLWFIRFLRFSFACTVLRCIHFVLFLTHRRAAPFPYFHLPP